jgi:hypothetical protein
MELSVIATAVRCSANYRSFLWQSGQDVLSFDNNPAASQTQDLQMKWPFSHVLPPSTSLLLPHLSQVLLDIGFFLSVQLVFNDFFDI